MLTFHHTSIFSFFFFLIFCSIHKCGSSRGALEKLLEKLFCKLQKQTTKSPTVSYHPAKFGCRSFCESINIRFSVLTFSTPRFFICDLNMWLKITRLDVLGPQNLSYQSAKFGGPRCCESPAITPIVTYLRGEKVT